MLQIQHIKKEYQTGSLVQKALDDVSLNLTTGQGLLAIDNPKEVGSHRKKLKIHACSA